MTSIKPPLGPTGQPTTPSAADALAPERAGDVNDVMGTTRTTRTPGLDAASAAGRADAELAATRVDAHLGVDAASTGVDSIAGLARAVESGRLSMADAVENLLSQAVGELGTHLSESERLELSEVLRSALTTDPTFTTLRGEQG